MATYVYIRKNWKRPFSYADKDTPHIQYRHVPMSTAFNMTTSLQVGWERASKKQYEHWLELKEKKENE
tara:strand:+ start:146 stop:349 length:204 start_codon:yes stop_codon:yes gene_type:complete